MANIVVTGAGRGIGRKLVECYASAGDHVYAWCRSPNGATQLDELASATGKVTALVADVTDEAAVERAAAALKGEPVDLLINAAGIFYGETGPEDKNFHHWRESFEVMVIGPFRVTQSLLPNLESANGKVISLSSRVGASTWPDGGVYSYGAAKAALNRVMKSLAVDLKSRKIAVAVVHPGYVKTDMGGPDADITVLESATGICEVASRLTLESTGGFFEWNGTPHPW